MRIGHARRAKVVAPAAGLALLALAAVAFAAVSGGDPKQPTRSTSKLLSIGQPVAPYRAGVPAEGWIEMRARSVDGKGDMAVLYHELTKVLRGRPVRHVCAEVGLETRVRRYPVREGGSCVLLHPRRISSPLALSVTSGIDTPVTVAGQATKEVRRIVVGGPGGTYELPLSRHRAFLLVYSANARGTATLTAHLRDGSTRFHEIRLPPDFLARPGGVTARDPSGNFDWSVSADLRDAGPRAGQTCATFSSTRPGFDFGAPLCGDLAEATVLADVVRWGPRRAGGTFGPGQRSPRRLILWGAAGPSVRSMRVVGPGGARALALSEVGRAFIAVYPAAVAPQQITLEATLADGTVERHVAPRRLNARRLAEQPSLRGRIGLRASRSDPSKLVLTGTLTRIARRFEVTLAGREVRMRRSGGTQARPRYVGIYDRDRGVRRTFVPGRSYRSSVLVCGAEGCVRSVTRSRLR